MSGLGGLSGLSGRSAIVLLCLAMGQATLAVPAAPTSPAALMAPAQVNAPQARAAVCLIEPDAVADVGSQVVGVVDRLHAQRGDMVTAGQPLVSLRADIERANADVAQARSRIDADVRAAQAALDLAAHKQQRAEALVAQSFVSGQAVEQARAERELALQKLNLARGQQQVYRQERRVADAQLGLRSVRSPMTGVVVERFVNPGERVEERPMMRVASIDPLRVELMVPTAQYGSIARGDTLTIRPELPGAAPVNATVSQIDRVMDAASNTFRVRLRLPNPGYRLPAGLRCKADLPGSLPTAAQPGKAATVTRPAVASSTAAATNAATNATAPRAKLRLALALE